MHSVKGSAGWADLPSEDVVPSSAEVGNAMGLVRLVRAGSMQFLASALRQVPSSGHSQAPTCFAEAAADNCAWLASDAHIAAAKRLDACLGDLQARSVHG